MINFKNSYRKYVFELEQINTLARTYPKQFIQGIEESFMSELENTVDYILTSKDCRIVMISGPSSSGKTTTSYRLKEKINKSGSEAVIVSLDNFFLGKDNVPLDEDGKRNYDSIDSVDVYEVKKCIDELIRLGESNIPIYNFSQMKRSKDRLKTKAKKNSIVIIEGIHALNPVLMPNIDSKYILKAYVDVKQGINDHNNCLMSSTDIRFVRRVVRDFKYRSTTVERTINMWESVCKNADIYIIPYKSMSDITLNSIHIYEPCIFSSLALPLLKQVANKDKYAKKIYNVLERFFPLPSDYVPETSLLKEFI